MPSGPGLKPAVAGVKVRAEPVFRPLDWALFGASTAVVLAALGVFDSHWVRSMQWAGHPVLGTLLTVPLLVGQAMYLARWFMLPLMRRPRFMPPRAGLRVGVVTTFVPGAEPIEMLAETVAALVGMDYAHETWVLDEGDDEAVGSLCARLGAHHFSRRHRPQYQTRGGRFERRTKHGNYNAWLAEIGFDRYDVIAAFDPDHVPVRHFLTHTLGYLEDESVAYVQPAQVYYNQRASFIARGAAEETYAQYSSLQMASYALGYPIVTGCHNVHRKSALHQIGGFPAHEADDLLMTIRYRALSWRGVYVPETLAIGLTPVTWAGYLTQQRRWARSVLDIKLRVYPRVAHRLPPLERLISLAHGLYYLYGLGMAVNLSVLCFMLLSGRVPGVFSYRTLPYLALLVAGYLVSDLFRQRFFLNPSERGLHWRSALLRLGKWPVVLAGLVDALRRPRGGFLITAKVRQPARRSLVVVPHSLTVACLVVAVLVGRFGVHVDNGPLYGTAALVVAGSLIAIATTLLAEAAPFDSDLLRQHWIGASSA